MFEFTEEEKEQIKRVSEAHDKYMREKYGDKFMEALEIAEKEMTKEMLKRFDNFAEVTRPDKFMCWDCGNDVVLTDEKVIEHVRKANLKTSDGVYFLICKKCVEEEEK